MAYVQQNVALVIDYCLSQDSPESVEEHLWRLYRYAEISAQYSGSTNERIE